MDISVCILAVMLKKIHTEILQIILKKVTQKTRYFARSVDTVLVWKVQNSAIGAQIHSGTAQFVAHHSSTRATIRSCAEAESVSLSMQDNKIKKEKRRKWTKRIALFVEMHFSLG